MGILGLTVVVTALLLVLFAIWRLPLRHLGIALVVIAVLPIAVGLPAFLRGSPPPGFLSGLLLIAVGAYLTGSSSVKRIAAFILGFPISYLVLIFLAPGPMRGGIWAFVVFAAALSIVVAVILPFGRPRTEGHDASVIHAPVSKTTCDQCGGSFPSGFYLERSQDGRYLCEKCRTALVISGIGASSES